ncbi:MAG: hypothetical protein Q7J42_10395 [Sulfuritalea sp.]|nr:hypothetical protein [Sulfuritalea sp.]
MSATSTHMPSSRPRLWVLLVGLTALALSGWSAAEPPSRVARLSYISGIVSFSPAGQPEWVQAMVNRPLTTGDRLWVDANSRAELQVGGAAIRLGAGTSVTLLNLDDRIAQVQLSQGTLKVRVRRMGPNQVFEVDTANLAFTSRRAGEYRIDVDPNDDATAVMVHSGRAEVYGQGASYAVTRQQGYRFYGTGLSDYDFLAVPRDDDLDRWARERDRRGDNSMSARYVSPEVVGYEDLDANGTWRADPNYGNVWTPTRVAAGWTPYHDGHWAWIDPWGWTWVDDAPWGFAVSHYGRWANIRGSWGWVPGPPRERAVYAPALVAFVGGNQVSLAVGSAIAAVVGWFPLAPREVYQPSYPVSRNYFDHINRSNAVIAPTTITKVYNTTNITRNTTIVNNTTNINVSKVVYANQQVRGAVVAVPAQVFVRSQPVAKAAVRVSKEAAASAPVVHVAAVAPVQQSMHGGAPNAGARPPARERVVVARTAPPPPAVAFAAQQPQMAAKPGTPIDETQRKQLKPAAPATPAPTVSVVAAAPALAPTAPPPVTAPAAKSPDARKAAAARSEVGKPDVDKTDAGKGEAVKADAMKADAAKAEAAKAAMAKTEASQADAAKAEANRADAVKTEAAKAATARAEASRAEAAKAEATRADAAKAEAGRAATARAKASRADAAKAATAKTEASRADAAKAEAARADAVKVEAAKTATAKAEASRDEAAKVEATRADAAKAEAGRAATARVEASRADAAKAEATRADAVKAEAAKAATARAEASRAEVAKAEVAKAASARAEASRTETAKADAVRAEAARAATARAEAVRAEAAKAEAVRAEAAKANAARANAGKAEAAKAATAKAEAARAEPAKAEDEKKKAEEEARKH